MASVRAVTAVGTVAHNHIGTAIPEFDDVFLQFFIESV